MTEQIGDKLAQNPNLKNFFGAGQRGGGLGGGGK